MKQLQLLTAIFFFFYSLVASAQESMVLKGIVPGRLSERISKNSFRQPMNLVLEGQIDRRDLCFIKEKLNVETLDLSRTKIASFEGYLSDTYPSTWTLERSANGFIPDQYSDNIKRLILPKDLKSVEDGAFVGYDLSFGIVIPKRVKSIVLGAFSFTRIKELEIPANVTSVDANVFMDCKLQKLRFASNSKLTFLCKGEQNAPMQLNDLLEIDLSQCVSLTECDGELADQCAQLTTLHLPKNIKKIGRYFITRCPKLDTILIETRRPPVLELEWNKSAIVYVPKGCRSAYEQSEHWCHYQIEEIGSPKPL